MPSNSTDATLSSYAPSRILSHFLLPFLLLFLHSLPSVAGHGMMLYPNQRGCLSPKTPYVTHPKPAAFDAEVDHFMHFPSGPKVQRAGAGHNYQIQRAGRRGWVPYNPFDPSFRLRAGICGDTVTGRDHLRGGKFFDGGRISATFTQGSVINMEFGITAHHNGFLELYVCDVSKCKNGDISHSCFTAGHCVRLNRAGNDICEKPGTAACGPVDRQFPSRWYIPCETAGRKTKGGKYNNGRFVMYGPGTIRYQLPRHLYCSHCVLQMYWTTANNCNPPGVLDYFTGPNRPKWPRCYGQGGAVGGYTARQKECGREKLPEEYYQCSDIRILQAGNNKRPAVPAPLPQQRRGKPPQKVQMPQRPQKPQRPQNPTSPKYKPQPPKSNYRPGRTPKRRGAPTYTKNNNNKGGRRTTATTNGELMPRADGYGAVIDIILIRNGRRVQSLFKYETSKIHAGSGYSIEAVTSPSTTYVRFQVFIGNRMIIDRVHRRSGGKARYGRMYLFGRRRNGLPFPWNGDVPIGKKLRIVVTARDAVRKDIDTAFLTFYR